ncbi:methyl-accepting chemotaxis protein, partial [Burkholderia glumae]
GFAVVAGEVRALAQRSANAAKEIKTLIENSVERVASGARRVDDAGRAMDDLVVQVKRVADLIAEISSSTSEQSVGVEQVDRAVVDLDNITQQNAALVEQSAAASESLRQQATSLVDAVGVFR